MGHVQEVTTQQGVTALGPKGVGFIYYYTRNDEGQMGTMNFRSSALTDTVNGEGKAYKTNTIYGAEHPNMEFRARTNALDLTFKASTVADEVREVPLAGGDLAKLTETLKLFPGLAIAPGMTPKKSIFRVMEEDGGRFDLEFYSIWPVLSPPDGTMRFLGQAGTSSFSEPMLVTMGTYNGKKVAGLSFLDRQWAPQYFGTYIMNGIGDLLKYAHALKYSHSWSAFHAHNLRTNEWTFFHLWHQYERADLQRDTLTDYSGMLYMKNGKESALVDSKDYDWTASGYVQQQGTEVMMDYAMGRVGFFPSRATYSSKKLGFSGDMYAFPYLQSLNQPIPFYEGYAAGEGTWNGDPVRLQGRLESSRLMFRGQDYQEMIEVLKQQKGDWQQKDLQAWLKANMNQTGDGSVFQWIHDRMIGLVSAMSEMDLKLAIFGEILSGDKGSPDPADPTVTVYH